MLQRFDWPITTTALMHRGMKWRTISSGLLLTTLPNYLIKEANKIPWNSIPVLETEPASENRIPICCGSTPGIRFYCKPVTLVRCREIRGENRFYGRVVGKCLCEMTSAFIINELRGARALRLFCGRSSFPPPIEHPKPSKEMQKSPQQRAFCFVLCLFPSTPMY